MKKTTKKKRAAGKLEWALVRCHDGPAILALIDNSCELWNGWEIPWFPDSSMERIAERYFTENPEDAPGVGVDGQWTMGDGDDDLVLERHRKQVPGFGFIALSDGDMGWCWERLPETDSTRAALTSALDQLVAEVAK